MLHQQFTKKFTLIPHIKALVSEKPRTSVVSLRYVNNHRKALCDEFQSVKHGRSPRASFEYIKVEDFPKCETAF